MSKWTQFNDMHSGGGAKEKWERIYIEAPIDEARIIFFNRFGHSPDRVTCTCCGEDYSLSESDSLEQATGYDRGCEYDTDRECCIEKQSKYGTYLTLDQYRAKSDVLIIPAAEIKPEERIGEVPRQGYVWQD